MEIERKSIEITPSERVINKLKGRKRYNTGPVQKKLKQLLEGIKSRTTFLVKELHEAIFDNKQFANNSIKKRTQEALTARQIKISLEEMKFKGELPFKVMENMERGDGISYRIVSFTFIPMDGPIPKVDGKKLFEDYKSRINIKTLIKNPFVRAVEKVVKREYVKQEAPVQEKKEETIPVPPNDNYIPDEMTWSLYDLAPEGGEPRKLIKEWQMKTWTRNYPTTFDYKDQWAQFVRTVGNVVLGSMELDENKLDRLNKALDRTNTEYGKERTMLFNELLEKFGLRINNIKAPSILATALDEAFAIRKSYRKLSYKMDLYF